MAAYNAILRQVAARHPDTVEVYDFGSAICPGGRFAPMIDGVRVRQADGIHFPYIEADATGQWLAAHLYPEVVRVGRLQQAGEGLDGRKLATAG